MATGPWKDEQRRPGPWPQGRRAPWAILAAVVAGVAVRVGLDHLHSHVVLGGLVILISMCGFYTAFRLNAKRLESERYTRGPGWFIGLAISKLPLGIARVVWLLLSVMFLALGVAVIAAG